MIISPISPPRAGSLKWYKALDNKEGASAGFTSFSVGAAAMTATFHDQVQRRV